MSNRKICVVTGTRAEYGLLFWLMKDIQADPDLDLQLAVTGTHLSAKFGNTVTVIEDDGFSIDERIDIEPGDDTPVGVTRSLGLGVIGFGAAFESLTPDIVVVLGDRYEILAAAEAAMLARIPIAHIHGGEATEGVVDEAIRHAVSKMAHLHFVAADPYRDRVVQLGESPERIFNVGAPGIDNIVKLDLPSISDLEKDIGLDLGGEYFLVTYHPVTLSDEDPGDAVGELLSALDQFPYHPVIITGVNADPGFERISGMLSEYAAGWDGRVSLHSSLGQRRYLGAMKHAAVVIGNSSSGILEAPAMKVPTVNLGDRQRGRIRTPSIIDCAERSEAIIKAIEQALSEEFRATVKTASCPYGEGGASERIKSHLKTADLSGLLMKRFHDIAVPA
jgi:UDP-hydrolysing UDP-N-acetyl-D-glucosamine 2-epimerase